MVHSADATSKTSSAHSYCEKQTFHDAVHMTPELQYTARYTNATVHDPGALANAIGEVPNAERCA